MRGMTLDPIQLQHENKQLRLQVKLLQEKLQLALARKFGASSEKASVDQLGLFNEVETIEHDLEIDDANETITVPAHERKKKPRVSIPADLPREDIIYDLPDDQKICPHDGHALKCIGSEDHEQLDIIPAKIRVLNHRRLTYGCPCCEQHMVTAQKPNQPIEKSIASPGLLATIATHKYADALPLYRQTEMFKRIGVQLDRTNLANWMVKMGDLTQPLIDHMLAHLQQQPIVHMDESTLQVLNEPGKAAQSKSYMWLMATFGSHPMLLYRYDASRSQHTPNTLLTEHTQALMVDGYDGYQPACEQYRIQRLGCWAHARRKFVDVQKAQPKGKAGKADQAIALIQKLYRIEAQTKDDPPDKRHQTRHEKAKPILDQLHHWMEKSLSQLPPSSKLFEALAYLKNQWPRLIGYLDDGRYPIDNNAAERAIRPFTIGRKNWLFSQSQAGAHASANLYSLIETAKANGVNPQDYLRDVFTRLPNMTTKDDMDVLLPWKLMKR